MTTSNIVENQYKMYKCTLVQNAKRVKNVTFIKIQLQAFC